MTAMAVLVSMITCGAIKPYQLKADEGAEQSEEKSVYSSYEGSWEEKKEDGTKGYTVVLKDAGEENTFDVFIESAVEDGQQEIFVAEAMFAEDESLYFNNGAWAVRTYHDDGTSSDELKGTNEEGALRYDPKESVLVWTYIGDNTVTDQGIEDPNEVFVFTKAAEEEKTEEPESEPEEQEKQPPLVYAGTAEEVIRNIIFVKEANGNTHMCCNNRETEFDFGKAGILGVDDDVVVEYEVNGNQTLTKKLTVTNHKVKIYWMQGTIVDVTDKTITITNNSLTVTFKRDGNTTVTQGKPTKGSIVNIGYIGDLSEQPYAANIVVIQENKEPEKYTAAGIISDFSDSYILLSINSAHAYIFNRNGNTTISGEGTSLTVGDSVIITYTGTIGQKPNALSVYIAKKAAPDKNTIAGNVVFIDPGTVTIAAGDNQYIIRTDGATVYTGDPMEVGCKAVITYTGAMNKDPLAV